MLSLVFAGFAIQSAFYAAESSGLIHGYFQLLRRSAARNGELPPFLLFEQGLVHSMAQPVAG